MGDVAKCSVGPADGYYNEALLYRLFGINAELLIDHAWGYEPCRMSHVKAYRPASNSLSSGQVLQTPYSYEKARLVTREMTDLLTLDLVDKGLQTNQLELTVGYDIENITDPTIRAHYQGEITTDRYGRKIPKHAHGTANLESYTSSSKEILAAMTALYERIVNKELLVRRITVVANRVLREEEVAKRPAAAEQISMFDPTPEEREASTQEKKRSLERERKKQQAVIDIKKKYGKNAILRGMNLEEGATAKDRNRQIGGHKA